MGASSRLLSVPFFSRPAPSIFAYEPIYILDVACVDDRDVLADGTSVAGALLHSFSGEALEGGDEIGAMAVEGFEVRFVRRQAVVNGHLAAARFVEHSHLDAVAEAGGAVAEDDVHVLDEAVVGDVVVGDVVLDVLDAAVVAYGDVVQGGVEDAGVFVYAARHLEALLERADSDLARETGVANVFEALLIGDAYERPVLGCAALRFEARDLSFCECSHKKLKVES